MPGTSSSSPNLELITIFHYVAAAIIYLKGLMAPFFMAIGVIALNAVMREEGSDPQAMASMVSIGIFFFVIPIFFLAVTATIGTAVLIAGRNIANRTNLAFCQVVAGLECLCVPFGTALGIFTLIALTRDDVKAQFQNTPKTNELPKNK